MKKNEKKTDRKSIKKEIFDIIQIGNREDMPSMIFDIFIVLMIFINLFVTLFSTFKESGPYSGILYGTELVTIIVFTIEYVLRVWTADLLYPDITPGRARLKFVFSFYGVVDLLTFFPFYLPVVFPAGAVAFRMFRVIRIFRLFRINAQYDAFNVIINVLKEKKNQLLSSVFMILILMTASSLCMYSLEHDAQPDRFENAFSGIWWATSTLLTVGYGDIYPVTLMGKIMAIIISFLGVAMVAVPTGIISAGFVEQYTRITILGSVTNVRDMNLKEMLIDEDHPWCGSEVASLALAKDRQIIMILRDNDEVIPTGITTIHPGDRLIIRS